jgi:hypothetical protein
MIKTPIAVAALVLLGACGGNKDTSNANNPSTMTDSSAGSVNAPPPSGTNPSTTNPSTNPSTTNPSATTTPPTDSSSMQHMGGDTSKMSGRHGHKMKRDSSTMH